MKKDNAETWDYFRRKFGNFIKEQRIKNNMTQTELAYKIGKSESSVRKYEAGLVEIPLSVIAQVFEILQVKGDTTFNIGQSSKLVIHGVEEQKNERR